MDWQRIINGTTNIVLFLLLIMVLDGMNTGYITLGLIFIGVLTIWFTYRIWFNKNDLMYQARERLETIMFGKPLYDHKKGEKIKMKKFGGWK